MLLIFVAKGPWECMIESRSIIVININSYSVDQSAPKNYIKHKSTTSNTSKREYTYDTFTKSNRFAKVTNQTDSCTI